MLGVVDALLMCAPGAFPDVCDFARRPGESLADRFEERLATLTAALGEPRLEAGPEWYPGAAVAASWPRGEKTVTLILEHDARCGARVLLWCVTDAERAAFLEAARGRAARVAADFEQSFDRQLAALAEPGRNSYVRFKMLVDDLAVVPDRAGDLLAQRLRHPDGEIRCHAVNILLELSGEQGLPHIVPLFDDPEDWVRWHVIGLMERYGDESVVARLVTKLRSDPDPAVRGVAAYALGHIGSPRAIPELLHALDHDQEYDPQGHSPSSTSTTALDNILGTNQTRIKHDGGLCSLAPWPPDYDQLRRLAGELYEQWKAEGGERPAGNERT